MGRKNIKNKNKISDEGNQVAFCMPRLYADFSKGVSTHSASGHLILER
jgi:hypothetical protein